MMEEGMPAIEMKFKFEFSPQDTVTVYQAIENLPFKLAAPILNYMRETIDKQQTSIPPPREHDQKKDEEKRPDNVRKIGKPS